MKSILVFLAKLAASKFGKIALDVVTSVAKKAIEPLYESVVKSMKTAENVGNYIKTLIESGKSNEEISASTFENFQILVTSESVEYFRMSFKGLGKYSIAFSLIKKELELTGKNYDDYLINFVIEVVMVRLFK